MRHLIALLLAVLAGGTAAGLRAEDADPAGVGRMKAAFLYKFLAYIEWPSQAFADSTGPLVVGVLGHDAAVDEIKEVIGERLVNGRAVMVRRFRDGDTLSGTHVLYVTRPERERIAALAATARASATLLVTDVEGALAHGSMINFRVQDGNVRFDIALDTAERAGLRISSRLLAVAQTVRAGP
jgi:hypothetical protein